MKLRRAKKGFTIVELVIVIGVIGILSAILIPTFINVTKNAEKSAMKSNCANAYSSYISEATDGVIDNYYYLDTNTEKQALPIVAKEQAAVTLEKEGKFYEFVGEEWKQVSTKTHTTSVFGHAYASSETYVYVDPQTAAETQYTGTDHAKLPKAVKDGTFNGYTVFYTPAE